MTIEFTSGIGVELVQIDAHDSAVVRAARVSTGTDLDTDAHGDGRLIRYLMKNRHGSPFEHGMFTFRVDAPIFVAREWQRHRVGWSYNEMSGRYTELPPRFYLPPPDRKIQQDGKPGAYMYVDGTPEQRHTLDQAYRRVCGLAWDAYREMIDGGVSRELARGVLPLTVMTAFYATCNPRSLMHWLSLRSESDRAAHPSSPMWEIAEAARQVEDHFKAAMPVTWTAYNDSGRVSP